MLNSANVKENYFVINEDEEMKDISIRILFQCNSRDEVYKNISDFMVNFRDEVDIKFNNLSHNYKCFFINSSIDETDFESWLYLNLNLNGYEYGDLISNKVSAAYNYFITIKNLKKNNKVVIDGINGSVKVGEENKFNDVELWEFPRIYPGVNDIKLSRSECSVIIKYYPRFI